MKNLRLSAKLWLILALMWLGLVMLGAWSVWNARSVMLQERRIALKSEVEIGETVLQEYAAKVARGELALPEAQKQAKAALTPMRFTPDGYYVVYDADFVNVVHPNPQIVGRNMKGNAGASGELYIQEQARVARASGDAYVTYAFVRPGETVAAPKITYARYFQPWGWTISTGVSVESVDTEFYAYIRKMLVYLVLIGGALSAMTFAVMRSVMRSLGGEPAYAAAVATKIADGDLNLQVAVGAKDTSSLLFMMRQMQLHLAGTIIRIRKGTEAINVGAREIAAGNLDLSSRTEQQAASLEETASSMEQLTATVKQNADNARQAGQLARTASDIAVRGGDVVGQVVETMEGITQSSRKIADIIGVIDGIAFQTNILALNAAVEAARAGEQGRGFAVVASEVRSLAQRSAQAAKEIKGLIDDSVTRVDSGSELVTRAGATMDEVVVAVKRVTDIMGEISAASEEQSQGIGQVNDAITQMDQVTQQNAALVEQAAAAAGSLEEQTRMLMGAVSAFQVAGDAGDVVPPVPKPVLKPAPIAHRAAPTRVAAPVPRPAARAPVKTAAVAKAIAAPVKRVAQIPPPAATAKAGSFTPKAPEGEGDWETF
jgi:methyl-accepting chemotaxis protein